MSTGWGRPLLLPESLLASLLCQPQQLLEALEAAWTSLEHPSRTAAPQTGTSFRERSRAILPNIPYKRERFGAEFKETAPSEGFGREAKTWVSI